MPFGAIAVGYAVSSEKGTSDGTGLSALNAVSSTLTTGKTVESSASRLFATYSLSKRTTVYAMNGKASVDTIAGSVSTLKTTVTSLGIKHGF